MFNLSLKCYLNLFSCIILNKSFLLSIKLMRRIKDLMSFIFHKLSYIILSISNQDKNVRFFKSNLLFKSILEKKLIVLF